MDNGYCVQVLTKTTNSYTVVLTEKAIKQLSIFEKIKIKNNYNNAKVKTYTLKIEE